MILSLKRSGLRNRLEGLLVAEGYIDRVESRMSFEDGKGIAQLVEFGLLSVEGFEEAVHLNSPL